MHNDIAVIAACALFGFSVGNLITLPSLIVQREFDPRSFGVLVSLITAINQITYAFGPGVIGLLRDMSGSYSLPFYGCIGAGADGRGADHDSRVAPVAMTGDQTPARSKSSRSSRFVNIASAPSGVRGHSSFGRSQ